MSKVKLSIITPFKGESGLLYEFLKTHEKLIKNESLDFIIIDSSEKKLLLKNSYLRYIHKPNLGLYEALNFGILNSKTKFYLTLGVDDKLTKEIFLALKKLSDKIDIASFPVKNCDFLLKSSFFRINHRQYVFQHSCSSIINKEIHSKIGLYPSSLKIASDSFIILGAKKVGYKIDVFDNIYIGIYGTKGISSRNNLRATFEMYLVTKKLGYKFSSLYYLISFALKFVIRCLNF